MPARKRWYDAYKPFAVQLETLKTAPVSTRDRIVAGVLEIISADAPELLEKYLLDFPLDQKKRRWYDQDAYLWLMVNGLEYSRLSLLKKVTAYMAGKGTVYGKKTEMKKTSARALKKAKKRWHEKRPARRRGR
ncbi:MAG: hypothetical protein JXA71_15870 [Chitinispirillaceae bacterium]|nr:hypothetical protein [Chitinispirillaceae bacterium]